MIIQFRNLPRTQIPIGMSAPSKAFSSPSARGIQMTENILILPSRFIPVSYTHLDVYKRQLQGSVADMIFADDWFDAVTAFETVYFWPDLPQCFRDVYRVLKPDGTDVYKRQLVIKSITHTV